MTCFDGKIPARAIPHLGCGSFALGIKTCSSGLCFVNGVQFLVSPLKFTRNYMSLPKSRPNPAAHCSHSETDSSQTKGSASNPVETQSTRKKGTTVMKLFKLAKTFRNDEDGAVTVDWVVLTAAIVGLGIAVLTSVSGGTTTLADKISSNLAGQTIASY